MFVELDENDPTVRLIVYRCVRGGPNPAFISHARIAASAAYVRSFYSDAGTGMIAGHANVLGRLAALVANGHEPTIEVRNLRVNPLLPDGGMTPAEVEGAIGETYKVELANKIERGRVVGNLYGVARYRNGARNCWVLEPQENETRARELCASLEA